LYKTSCTIALEEDPVTVKLALASTSKKLLGVAAALTPLKAMLASAKLSTVFAVRVAVTEDCVVLATPLDTISLIVILESMLATVAAASALNNIALALTAETLGTIKEPCASKSKLPAVDCPIDEVRKALAKREEVD